MNEESMSNEPPVYGVNEVPPRFEDTDPETAQTLMNFYRLPEHVRDALQRKHGGINSETVQRETPKVGRNDPCPCGSGKKFKKCCGGN